MTTFIISPVDIKPTHITVQIFVDSSIRKHGFVGMVNFTVEEFEDFRGALIKGAKNNKKVSLNLHPTLLPE